MIISASIVTDVIVHKFAKELVWLCTYWSRNRWLCTYLPRHFSVILHLLTKELWCDCALIGQGTAVWLCTYWPRNCGVIVHLLANEQQCDCALIDQCTGVWLCTYWPMNRDVIVHLLAKERRCDCALIGHVIVVIVKYLAEKPVWLCTWQMNWCALIYPPNM